MVRIEDFHIQFSDKWAVYHPGDQVTGSVHFRLNDKVFADSILAHFYGLARVMWINRETKDGAFRAVPYTSEHVYFDQKTQLWHYSSAADCQQKLEAESKPTDPLDIELEELLNRRRGHQIINSGPHLKPGSHTFEFSFQLPPSLPTSFDAKHSDGYIRYSVKICVMSQDLIKHSRKAYFSIVKPEDLNLMSPILSQPVCEEASKLCKNSLFGSPSRDCLVRMSATMEKRGYVPGEPVYVQVNMENLSKKSMKMFKMHLMQHLVCHVDRPDVESKRAIAPVASVSKVDKVRPGIKTTWCAGPVYIPAVVPTFCVDNIAVSYSILIEGYRDRDYAKLRIDLPIVIGTVPLNQNEKLPIACAMPTAPMAPCEPPPQYDSVVGIPPPTYEESIAGVTGGKENQDEACVPRYIVYNFQ